MAPQGGSGGAAVTAAVDTVTFYLNGKSQIISPTKVPPSTRLVDYIRYHANITGTKAMCREGGCGACIVVATVPDPTIPGGGTRAFSVQACQLLVYACSGWSIETVEALGNRYDGYHTVQKALTGFYGTQCGYCSPGMVMTMYGELKRTGTVTTEQAERALDGNLCRCTGYRPILDAFKSMAVDGEQHLKQRLADIEDVYKTCPKSGRQCAGKCPDGGGAAAAAGGGVGCSSKLLVKQQTTDWSIVTSTIQWISPVTLQGVLTVMKKAAPEDRLLLVSGNTGAGVFKNDGPFSVYISLDAVPELHEVVLPTASRPLVVGCRVSLTRCIQLFKDLSSGAKAVQGYSHLEEVADHWTVVANLAVRNNGTWSGNLAMKSRHKDFPSDVFLTLAACNAVLTVADPATDGTSEVAVLDLPGQDLERKLIVSVTIPPLPQNTFLRTFKITPRAANAHAYVNAALRVPADSKDGYKVTAAPSLLFGGLGAAFVSASKTEQYLTGKSLSDPAVVQEAARLLAEEAVPAIDPHQGTVEYRRLLVQALFYKTVVWIQKSVVSPSLMSAADKLQRGLNRGQQDFDANADSWPIGQAIPKVESAIQVSGEAEYADDQPLLPGELHGAFVLSTIANARIGRVDATQALAVPGVVDFVTAVDISGTNTFFGAAGKQDKVFAKEGDRTDYCGQSLGLVVAVDRETALAAAQLVTVTYSDQVKPVLTIQDAIKKKQLVEATMMGEAVPPVTTGDYQAAHAAASHHVKGSLDINTQFHFTMELMASRVVPMEDGYDVVCCTQHINDTQSVLANLLGVPANSINMEVRRLGGAFGCKITRCNVVACAAATAAAKLRKPVRVVLDLTTQMKLVGWREPYYSAYEAGFDDSGKLQSARIQIYSDPGFVDNESSVAVAMSALNSTYHVPNSSFEPKIVKTDTAANTWCRTPGHVEAIATIENMMEHIAAYLNKDPLQVKEINMAPDETPEEGGPNEFMKTLLPLLKEKAMLEQRKSEIESFNANNRWRKRGLSVTPLKYPFPYPPPFRYSAQVIIYEHDGTVAISHGGIEMGQGINTKAVQVAAGILDVPLSSVKVKPTNAVAAANSFVTGGSYGTDLVCHGVKICCERLKGRIDAVRDALPEPKPAWPELIKMCLHKDVDLSERYWTVSNEHPLPYNIWGGASVEVEVDVLTGQHVTRRVDLIEDAGRSLSPYVDIGQVEGSLVMGLGLFTTEYMQFDETTGNKLVTGTWEYKPPTALDIPADLRITLLPNAPNPFGVLRSKATGEPALCMSYGVVTALRQAIASARKEAGVTGWFDIPLPLTVERIQQLCLVQASQFLLTNTPQKG